MEFNIFGSESYCCLWWTVCALLVFVITLWYNFGPTGSVSADGKSVLITGCDSGFGNLLAHRLLSMRFHVFALCLDDASPAAQKLRSSGADVLKCDVTSDDDVQRCRSRVDEQLQRKHFVLWALVNNAGIGHFNFVEWTPLEDFRRQYDVNAFGVVRMLHAFLPYVRKSKGRVVNVASQAGRYVVPHFTAYCMSKHAVVALSDGLRMELKSFGVRVSIIQPIFYGTNILDFEKIDAKCLQMWNKIDKEVRDDYGLEFFTRTQKHQRANIARTTRHDLNEVIETMAHAVTSLKPRDVYDCHWLTTVNRILVGNLPTWLTDRLKLWIFTSGRPATATA